MLRHEQGGYAIRDEGGDIVHFSDKMIAKKSKQGTQVVSYGIDHRNYKLKKGDI